MKKLLTTILLITLLVLPMRSVVAQDVEVLKKENAVLRNALSQALNRLEFFENLKQKSEALIDAQRAEIKSAKAVIAANEVERAAMQKVITEAEKAISLYQQQIVEYDKQIIIWQKKVALLESQLKREKRRSKFLKTLLIIVVPLAAIGGVWLGNQDE